MARNVADFMSEIFNGVGGVSGVNAQLNNKLDKTANAVSASKLQTARSMKVSLASNSAANFDGSANVTVGVDGILPASHGGTGVSNLQNLNVGFATTASVAATSNFATRADQDCDGNKISTTYLKAGGTVASANKLATSRSFQTNLASTAAAGFDGTANNTHGVTGTLGVANGGTGQTSLANVTVGAANKATLDGSGNNIASTYLSKTDAASTYLGKSAKAASATTADSATKATLDGSGNNIVNTYAKKSEIPSTSGLLTKTQADGYYLGKTDKAASATTADSATKATTSNGVVVYSPDGNFTAAIEKIDNGSATWPGINMHANHVVQIKGRMVGGGAGVKIYCEYAAGTGGKTYEFKSDGIYLDGTKITN